MDINDWVTVLTQCYRQEETKQVLLVLSDEDYFDDIGREILREMATESRPWPAKINENSYDTYHYAWVSIHYNPNRLSYLSGFDEDGQPDEGLVCSSTFRRLLGKTSGWCKCYPTVKEAWEDMLTLLRDYKNRT